MDNGGSTRKVPHKESPEKQGKTWGSRVVKVAGSNHRCSHRFILYNPLLICTQHLNDIPVISHKMSTKFPFCSRIRLVFQCCADFWIPCMFLFPAWWAFRECILIEFKFFPLERNSDRPHLGSDHSSPCCHNWSLCAIHIFFTYLFFLGICQRIGVSISIAFSNEWEKILNKWGF